MLENRKDWHDRKSGGFVLPLFLLSLCTFFFCLDTKEKVPKKKKSRLSLPGYSGLIHG